GGPVNAYRVWRRIPPAVASARLADARRTDLLARPADDPLSTLTEYWEAIVTLPAQRLAGYGYTAATTQDSIAGSNPYTAFFVSALTSNIDVFYSSAVDSGYSVDNIHPPATRGFTEAVVPSGVSLNWEHCPDTDLDG